jgi:hypothetical protein
LHEASKPGKSRIVLTVFVPLHQHLDGRDLEGDIDDSQAGFEYISAWRRWQVRIRSVPWTKLKDHPEIGNDRQPAIASPNIAPAFDFPRQKSLSLDL